MHKITTKKYRRGKTYLTVIQVNADYQDRVSPCKSTDNIRPQELPTSLFLSANPLSSIGNYYSDLESNHLPAT